MPSKLLDGIWRNKSQYMLIEHQIDAVDDRRYLVKYPHAGGWQSIQVLEVISQSQRKVGQRPAFSEWEQFFFHWRVGS